MGIYLCRATNWKGPKRRVTRHRFLTAPNIPILVLSYADGTQRSEFNYFSNWPITSLSCTPKAWAIFAAFTSVGTCLWLSIKLIAGRVSPVNSASLSWDSPCFLRSFASSSTTFPTKASEVLFSIQKMIADLYREGYVSILTYRRRYCGY